MDNNIRRHKMFHMRREGKTYREIGDYFKLTRQRIHQIITIRHKPYINRIKVYAHKKWEKVYAHKKWELEGRDHLREKVRQRDNYTCQKCGKQWKNGMRRLDVHHIDLNKESLNGRKYKDNKDFNLMITLCHKCHLNLDGVKKKMQFIREKKLALETT